MNTVYFRRHLHSNPELPFEEHATSAFISEQLDALGIEHCMIVSTGVLARVEGRRGNHRRCVVLRADIDAQPMQEMTGVEWASRREGVMHSAGGDCHAAVLFGVLKRLHTERDFEGTLLALFEPGTGCGVKAAKSVLDEDPFKDYDVAAIIGQQTDSTLEVGQMGFCPGKYLASSDELHFMVRGTGGEVAMGSRESDAVVAAANLILRLSAFNSDMCAIAVSDVRAHGEVAMLPDRCECKVACRTYDEKLRLRVKDMITHATEEIEYKHNVEIVLTAQVGNPVVENHTQLTYEAMLLADSLGIEVHDVERSANADEFGFYSQLYPALYYSLGVGGGSGRRHTATYLPDERALAVGEEFMYELALSILNK